MGGKYTKPTIETVKQRIKNSKNGLTYDELKKMFFGAEIPKPEDDQAFRDCLETLQDKMEITLDKSTDRYMYKE